MFFFLTATWLTEVFHLLIREKYVLITVKTEVLLVRANTCIFLTLNLQRQHVQGIICSCLSHRITETLITSCHWWRTTLALVASGINIIIVCKLSAVINLLHKHVYTGINSASRWRCFSLLFLKSFHDDLAGMITLVFWRIGRNMITPVFWRIGRNRDIEVAVPFFRPWFLLCLGSQIHVQLFSFFCWIARIMLVALFYRNCDRWCSCSSN